MLIEFNQDFFLLTFCCRPRLPNMEAYILFFHLLVITGKLCTGRQVFQTADVLAFFYQRSYNDRNTAGALTDIAFTQRNRVTGQTLSILCKFFLEHASHQIINRALRSMFRCLDVHLRRDVDYLRMLSNIDAAEDVAESRTRDDAFTRAAHIVLMLNVTPARTTHAYLQAHADEKLWLVYFNFTGRIISPPRNLRDSRTLVLAASKIQSDVLQWASDRLKNDRDFVKQVIRNHLTGGYNFEVLPPTLQDDDEIALLSAQHWGGVSLIRHPKHGQNKEIVREVVKRDGRLLREAFPIMQDDMDVVRDAMSETIQSLRFASLRLRANVEFILSVATRRRRESDISWIDLSMLATMVKFIPVEARGNLMASLNPDDRRRFIQYINATQ